MKAALNRQLSKPEEADEHFEERKDSKPIPELEKIINLLKGNTGLIFSNGDLS
jgi:hypothetical protein